MCPSVGRTGRLIRLDPGALVDGMVSGDVVDCPDLAMALGYR